MRRTSNIIRMNKSQESVGPNPTDRGKNGSKRSVLTQGKGLPIAVVIDGANRHYSKLLESTLDKLTPQQIQKTAGKV